jgi:signal peptidase
MEQPQVSLTKRIIKIVLNVLFYTAIVFLLVFSIANMQVKRDDNIANIFGIGMLSVQSNSMYGELDDSFEKGDMLFVKMLDDESRAALEVGDIVTYFDLSIYAFNTHRIVEINESEGYLVTQADYNYVSENNNTEPDQPVNIEDVISVYTTSKISGFGSALDYLQTSAGFAIFIIIPVILLLIGEGVILTRTIMSSNKEKLALAYEQEKEDAKKELESEKERMRAEILAELKKEKEKSA